MLTPTPCPPTRSDSAPRTLLNGSISSCKAQHCRHPSTPLSANIKPAEPMANSVSVDPVALMEDFCLGVKAYMAFFLELSNIHYTRYHQLFLNSNH